MSRYEYLNSLPTLPDKTCEDLRRTNTTEEQEEETTKRIYQIAQQIRESYWKKLGVTEWNYED